MSIQKYQIIINDVLSNIESGKYKAGDKLPTEKEFAETYLVSSTTVVKALNELAKDGHVNRLRGSGTYIADQEMAPIIKGRKTKIGILWTEHLTPESLFSDFFGKISQGILNPFNLGLEETLWNKNDSEAFNCAKWLSKNNNIEIEAISELESEQMRRPSIDIIKEKGFDGLLTLGIINDQWLSELINLKIPTVFIDILNQKFDLLADQVYVDPIPGFRKAISYFLKKGLKRIHFVAGYKSIPAPNPGMSHKEVADFRKNKMVVDPDSYLRLAAFRQILDEQGIHPEKDWVHINQPLELNDHDLAIQLLNRDENDIPQAIFCHGIDQAKIIMEEFSKVGRYIYATAITPNLNYGGPVYPIFVNGFEMGSMGIELLISKIQRPNRISFRVGAPMDFSSLQ
ncbi:MAG: hypothetical protein COA79_03285 [Planctomycetota bacterium]|nr:MAG: hypothetical protein COA79_03285 [Planctomycetota bacterium]